MPLRNFIENINHFLKVLSPAGNIINPLKVLRLFLYSQNRDLREKLQSAFPDHYVYTVNSGKCALLLVLEAIREISDKKELAFSAYTCPDIAVCGVLAGFKLRLIDTENESTTCKVPEPYQLEDSAAFVASNLYGLPDTQEIPKLCAKLGVIFIDDACQSSLSDRSGKAVGVSSRHIGIFSAGRGKGFSGVGGGMILIPKADQFQDIFITIEDKFDTLTKGTNLDSISYLIKLSLTFILQRPFWYGIISKLPGLGLGETNVNFDWPMRTASKAELALLQYAVSKREKLGLRAIKNLALYKLNDQSISKFPLSRLPILLDPKERELIFSKFSAALFKLGASKSYPSTIDEYESLKEHCSHNGIPNAKRLANSVVTLPVHRFVKPFDVKRLKKILFGQLNHD